MGKCDSKIEVASGIKYVVFLLPVVLSIAFGSIVMAEVLQEPDRQLNMLQFGSSGTHTSSGNLITIIGLESEYSTETPIKITVTIDDEVFDCGDLYITIYNAASKQVITQSGYFGQCFDRNNSILPVDDEFSETIDTPGNYELVVESIDKHQQKTTSTKAKFTVK